MNDQRFWRIERAAGLFLVLSFLANLAGVVMFSIRGGASGGTPPSSTYYLWERGLFMAAIVLAAIGFVLLEGHLHTTAGHVLGRTGRHRVCIRGNPGCNSRGARPVGKRAESLSPDRRLCHPGIPGSGSHRRRVAPIQLAGAMDRLGHHPLEPGMAARASRDHAAGHLFSNTPSSHATPDRCPTAAQSTIAARHGAADRAAGICYSPLTRYLEDEQAAFHPGLQRRRPY